MATKGAAAQPGRWEPRRKAGPQAREFQLSQRDVCRVTSAAISVVLSITGALPRSPRCPFLSSSQQRTLYTDEDLAPNAPKVTSPDVEEAGSLDLEFVLSSIVLARAAGGVRAGGHRAVATGLLQKGLTDTFADVQVSVVDCPNLTEEPFTFPVKGICGKTRIAEVGGVPYLLPLINKKKVYDLNKIAKEIQLLGAFVLGAGAGPFQTLGFNSEFMPVIEVKAKRRIGKLNFVTCMRQTLEKHYGDKPVGMGGTFVIQKGKVKTHIMPAEFSSCPLNSDALSH
ncbi:ester hydrolase C11orf54-like [Balaenoptera acutorostrata]|uniref:Ester hydrolase C11orf54-like n=1 Tax=Balaenoptera acutorostrata TaxID=9767 RepID=A0ABM3S785_BALAC|nr:ester hydrolase C11orf54-like [Balaenoptera acutorostrata]